MSLSPPYGPHRAGPACALGHCSCCVVYGPPPVRFDADKIKDAVAKAFEANPELVANMRRHLFGAALFNAIAPLTGEAEVACGFAMVST